MLRMIDEYYQAYKVYLIKKIATRCQNISQRFALYAIRLFWYTWELDHPVDVEVVPSQSILRVNAKKSLKNKRQAIKKRKKG